MGCTFNKPVVELPEAKVVVDEYPMHKNTNKTKSDSNDDSDFIDWDYDENQCQGMTKKGCQCKLLSGKGKKENNSKFCTRYHYNGKIYGDYW